MNRLLLRILVLASVVLAGCSDIDPLISFLKKPEITAVKISGGEIKVSGKNLYNNFFYRLVNKGTGENIASLEVFNSSDNYGKEVLLRPKASSVSLKAGIIYSLLVGASAKADDVVRGDFSIDLSSSSIKLSYIDTSSGSEGQVLTISGGAPSWVTPQVSGATQPLCLRPDGSVPVTSNIDFGGNKATNLAVPTLSTDATTKAYVDSQISNQGNLISSSLLSQVLKTDGSNHMSSDMDLNGNKIINVSSPVLPTDAANKTYTDSKILGKSVDNTNSMIPGAVLVNSGSQFKFENPSNFQLTIVSGPVALQFGSGSGLPLYVVEGLSNTAVLNLPCAQSSDVGRSIKISNIDASYNASVAVNCSQTIVLGGGSVSGSYSLSLGSHKTFVYIGSGKWIGL